MHNNTGRWNKSPWRLNICTFACTICSDTCFPPGRGTSGGALWVKVHLSFTCISYVVEQVSPVTSAIGPFQHETGAPWTLTLVSWCISSIRKKTLISLHSNESRAADLTPDLSLSRCFPPSHSFRSKAWVRWTASAEASCHGSVGRREAVLEHLWLHVSAACWSQQVSCQSAHRWSLSAWWWLQSFSHTSLLYRSH